MNQIAAFKDTLELADSRGMADCEFEEKSVGFDHLVDMLEIIELAPDGTFSESKIGRWLGWAQCAVVAGGYATLQEMKEINRKHRV
jgi:hypothetical protein